MRFQRKTFSCYTSRRVLEDVAMKENRHNSHSVTRLTAHVVWVTKYRYHVLQGEIKMRCRDLIVQICDTEDVRILKGVVSKDHVHMHIEYPPSKSISDLIKRFKGRTSRLLQQEYPELKRRYWGKHFWAIGYGAWSTGNITEEMVQEYLEHHRDPSNRENNEFILE
jgi:REP-associated tyrosine transposase